MDTNFSLKYSLTAVTLVILATGLTAEYGFLTVETFFSGLLQEHTRARGVTEDMLASLDRQEKAHMRALAQPEQAQAEDPANQRPRFEDQLRRVKQLLQTPQERSALARLEADWTAHQAKLRQYLDARASAGVTNVTNAQHAELSRSLRNLKTHVAALIGITTHASGNPVAEIRATMRRFAVGVCILTALSTLGATWIAHNVSRMVLQPLRRFSRNLDRVLQGELHLRLSTERDRALRQLALSCNRLLENLQQLTEESRHRIHTERQLAVVLIESLEQPAAAMNTAGDVLLANAPARELLKGQSGDAMLKHLRQCLTDQDETLEHNGIVYRVDPVSPPGPRTLDVHLVRLHPPTQG